MLGGLDYRSLNAAVKRALASMSIDGSSGANGRLTLQSGVAVPTSDQAGKTTVYFTPHRGNKVELYDGSNWEIETFSELSQATTDATRSPAAVANNSNYDVFAWNDGGTLRATRGPAWTSDTGRGAGAGTTELELFEGRYVNKNTITNGPAARRGLYVGTIRSDGSAQINDTLAKRHVWNTYNRCQRALRRFETTDNWTYTNTPFRQANNSALNQVEMVRGLDEDEVSAFLQVSLSHSAGNIAAWVMLGLDSTSVGSGLFGPWSISNTVSHQLAASYIGLPGLGYHYLAWLEASSASGTSTWYGDNGGADRQSGIHGSVLA